MRLVIVPWVLPLKVYTGFPNPVIDGARWGCLPVIKIADTTHYSCIIYQ